MSGIAALAAAAAATQKIPGAGVTTTPVSGIKVVSPAGVVTPGGVRVASVPGGVRQGQGESIDYSQTSVSSKKFY